MQQNRTIIYLSGFLFSLPIALSAYINSSFISSFIGEKFVGIVYILGSIGSVAVLLLAPKVFEKIGGYRFLLSIVLLNAFSFLILTFTKNTGLIVAMFILGFSMNTLIFFSLDEILKIFSENSVMGKIRGSYMAISNSAWVVAQILSATILGGFSFRTIYLSGFFAMILFLILAFLKLKNIPDPSYDKITSLKYIKDFIKNRNFLIGYGISFLLQFFFCLMVIYTPIYLYNHIGLSWKEISLVFAVMLIPFVIIPFHLGKYSDKIGERKMLMLGFIIISISTISIFFISGKVLWIWAILLFVTRVGASIVEVMGDTYFFKHIKPENEEFVGVYRTASPLGYIIGPIVASVVLIFVPSFNFIYIVLGILMLSGIYLSSTIEKTDI